MRLTLEQLQQLVAPIALYPDSLVAQILAASTFPEEVVDADRWVQSHPDLKGEALAQAVDQMPWDPSVKALVAFPSVLGNMDKNLSWTSSLGDTYYNQEQDVMDAVQVMRRRAQEAGNLNSTTQQVVTTEGSDIQIEPVSPEIVYVPAYDPWIVYGGPIVEWPGWYPYPGIWYDGPSSFFGPGFGIGFFGHCGWGWHHSRFCKMPRFMIAGGMCYTRLPAVADQVFVCLRPHWDRGVCWRPVSVGGFVTPRHEPRHDFQVRSGAAKRLHSLFALPHGQSPKCSVRVEKEPSASKPRRANDLALSKKGLPEERRKVPHRSYAKAGDGCEHRFHSRPQTF
jgi:hypothetical protein